MSKLPRFIEPARAAAATVPPSGPEWVHEIKMDGYRVQVRLEGGRVTLSTRGGLDWTARFLGLVPAFEGLAVQSAIIDGEVVVEDARGVADFTLLQAALKSPRSPHLAYVAFDLLYVDGASLLDEPLVQRKSRLADVLAARPVSGPGSGPGQAPGPLRYCEHLEGDGRQILAAAARLGVEGIVSKRRGGRYRPGRADWRKVKLTSTDELVVCGYVEATSPKGSVGALVLGCWEGNRLVHVGRVGTGFSREVAAELWARLEGLRIRVPPVPPRPDDAPVRWVPPVLVVQVEYSGWTADGVLRHARFKGLRGDKPARDVASPAGRPPLPDR